MKGMNMEETDTAVEVDGRSTSGGGRGAGRVFTVRNEEEENKETVEAAGQRAN